VEKVKIYIDRVEHESHAKTDGAALYILGKINPITHDLWREEKGKKDDELIQNNQTEVHVNEWTHFYSSQKTLNPGNGSSKR